MKVYRTPKGEKKSGIYVRDDSPYLWIAYTHRKKRLFESTKTTRFKEAQALLEQRKREIGTGKFIQRKLDDIKLEELAEDFIDHYENMKSAPRARVSKEHLLRILGKDTPANEITTEDIKKYRKHREGEKRKNGEAPSIATINRELAALKKMFSLGTMETPPKVAAIPFIPMIKENNTRTEFFEHDEYLDLRTALPRQWSAFVTAAYHTGMRAGELRGLTWKQVRFGVDKEGSPVGSMTLAPGTTKNNKGRTVYMPEELLDVLKEQDTWTKENWPDCPWVFHVDGEQVRESGYRSDWNLACKAVGLEGRRMHDFRRTGIRKLVRAGVSDTVAMKISGHKTRSIFDRYNITDDTDLREAAKKLDAAQKHESGQQKPVQSRTEHRKVTKVTKVTKS
jgi:integrase